MQKVCDGAQTFLFTDENLHVKILIANLRKRLRYGGKYEKEI